MTKEEQVNYALARAKIEKFIDEPLSHEMVQEIHATVMGSSNLIGCSTEFGLPVVRNPVTGEVRYRGPNAWKVSLDGLILELLDWVHQALTPVEQAARLHWGLVKIHPFDDGNGRTARILVLLILRKYGYNDLVCRNIEEYFENFRSEYDDSLHDGKDSYSDFKHLSLQFINYIKAGLEIALVKERMN